MKFILSFLILLLLTVLTFPAVIFGQAPNLGTAANFVLFTATGAVGNTGVSLITGDVGTNAGAITGFDPPAVMVGNIYNADAVTLQCITDLNAAYTQLDNTAPTSTNHTPAFGTGETLFAGVYSIAAAGSVAGILNLDAQGNAGAVFIFKFGGQFSTSGSATVNLLNGALASNVFWKAEGAIPMGAGTVMKGTLIANNGAISIAAGSSLEGRMLSTTGAASIDASVIFLPTGTVLPLTLIDFKAIKTNSDVKLLWNTANEVSLSRYELTRSADGRDFYNVGMVPATNVSFVKNYSWLDNAPLTGVNFYRLRMIDIDGAFKYSAIVKVDMSGQKGISVYPNPVTGHVIMLQMYGQLKGDHLIALYNTHGKKVMSNKIIFNGNDAIISVDLEKDLPNGIYYLKISDPENNNKTFKINID